MSKRQDEIAAKAVRKSTLKSLKSKKKSRLEQLKKDYEDKVREINILFAEDPERLKAKYAAEDYAKSERAKVRAEKRIAREKAMIEYDKTTRKPSTAEELCSSIIQGIGACLFIAGTAILDTIAIQKAQEYITLTTVMYSLFGASMIFMYLFSTLKHAITNFTAKTVFNRLAHVFSFLIIGFAYSAYTITKIQGVRGWILFGIVWALVLVGILFYSISGRKHDKLNIILSCIAGFSGLIFAKNLFEVLSMKSFGMLISAAVCFVLGILFYSLKKIKFMHFVANILLLAGSIYLFFSLFFINA